MQSEHYAARARLRELMGLHPDWTHRQLAQAVGYSVPWVRKWRQRHESFRQNHNPSILILQGPPGDALYRNPTIFVIIDWCNWGG